MPPSATKGVVVFLGKLIRRAGRGIGRVVRSAAPILKKVAPVAGPIGGVAAVALLVLRSSRGRAGRRPGDGTARE